MVSAVMLKHKLSYALVQFQTIISWVQVDVLTLECAEEAFLESIIGCSSFVTSIEIIIPSSLRVLTQCIQLYWEL